MSEGIGTVGRDYYRKIQDFADEIEILLSKGGEGMKADTSLKKHHLTIGQALVIERDGHSDLHSRLDKIRFITED